MFTWDSVAGTASCLGAAVEQDRNATVSQMAGRKQGT